MPFLGLVNWLGAWFLQVAGALGDLRFFVLAGMIISTAWWKLLDRLEDTAGLLAYNPNEAI